MKIYMELIDNLIFHYTYPIEKYYIYLWKINFNAIMWLYKYGYVHLILFFIDIKYSFPPIIYKIIIKI